MYSVLGLTVAPTLVVSVLVALGALDEGDAKGLLLFVPITACIAALVLMYQHDARVVEISDLCADLYAHAETRLDSLEIYVAHDYCELPGGDDGE